MTFPDSGKESETSVLRILRERQIELPPGLFPPPGPPFFWAVVCAGYTRLSVVDFLVAQPATNVDGSRVLNAIAFHLETCLV